MADEIPVVGFARLFSRRRCARIIGAHSPLGAKLGARAGFDAIWASGLEISASLGVPDANIVSASEVCRISSGIAAATDLPVMVDMDSGYGEPQQVFYAVRDFVRAGVKAVCIEDKPFPKSNSFSKRRQTLQATDDFVAKLQAAAMAREKRDFWIVARAEGFVVGEGVADVLARARAYVDAGADAVVVQSRRKDAQEIEAFCSRWRRPQPIIAIPTSYPATGADTLYQIGVRGVIYANHGLRASIRAMQTTFATILEEGSSAGVEASLASLNEVFDLQGDEMIDHLEKRATRRRRRPA